LNKSVVGSECADANGKQRVELCGLWVWVCVCEEEEEERRLRSSGQPTPPPRLPLSPP